MKEAETNFITIGKIGSTYGVQGFLKIYAYTEFGGNILEYSPWYLSKNGNEWRKIAIEESRLHHNTIIAKFAHIHTPEAARLLTGELIGIERSQLPALKKDEYYWSDLVGLDVLNTKGEHYGKVIYLLATGSNDVLVVKNTKEHGIPFLLGTVVLEVNLDKRQIIVDWELI